METNRLAHSNKPGEAARRAAEVSKNIRDQTPEEKIRTDAQVQEGKERAGLGTPELQAAHHAWCQRQLPRMLVRMGLLRKENQDEAQELLDECWGDAGPVIPCP